MRNYQHKIVNLNLVMFGPLEDSLSSTYEHCKEIEIKVNNIRSKGGRFR